MVYAVNTGRDQTELRFSTDYTLLTYLFPIFLATTWFLLIAMLGVLASLIKFLFILGGEAAVTPNILPKNDRYQDF